MGPELIEWYITNKCCLKCIHCFNGSSTEYSQPSIQLLKETAKALVKLNPKVLNISGGEPFTFKYLFDIAEILCSNKISLSLSTSGWYINKKNAINTMNYFDGIQFSLDSCYANTHDYIRGRKGSLERVINSIRILRDISADYDIQVCMVVNKYNYNHIEDTIKLANELCVNNFKIMSLYPIGRSSAHSGMFLSDDNVLDVLERVIDLKHRYKNMGIFYKDAVINLKKYTQINSDVKVLTLNYDGQIKITPYLPFTFGNAFNDDINTIWYEKIQHFFDNDIFLRYMKSINTSRDLFGMFNDISI